MNIAPGLYEARISGQSGRCIIRVTDSKNAYIMGKISVSRPISDFEDISELDGCGSEFRSAAVSVIKELEHAKLSASQRMAIGRLSMALRIIEE